MGTVAALAIGSGTLVGFTLGLLGGGGSILAVPLLLYVVGLRSMHLAIGTGSVAVAISAFTNLAVHARAATVKWPCAAVFAVAGLAGATLGAALGKRVDGGTLELWFAVIMLIVALAMFMPRAAAGDPGVRIDRVIAIRLVAIGMLVGFLSGFFGIGGGFLIVPGIMLGSGMATLNAVGSSLLSVGVFASATAASYAFSGLVDWPVAGWFVLGGLAGGWAGSRLAHGLSSRRKALNRAFASTVVVVASYILWRVLGS